MKSISGMIQQSNKSTGKWCSEWHSGVMVGSSWHQQETLVAQEDFDTSEKMVARGQLDGCLALRYSKIQVAAVSESGDGHEVVAIAPALSAIVAHYADDQDGNERPAKMLGAVGSVYKFMPVAGFAQLCEAAYEAGCRGEAIFALRNGARIIASFEMPSTAPGFAQYLTVIDSLDGSGKLQVIISTVRVVCANTVASAQATAANGKVISIRHTGDMEEKACALAQAMSAAVRQGDSIVAAYEQASKQELSAAQWEAALDDYAPLFVTADDDDGNSAAVMGGEGDAVDAAGRLLLTGAPVSSNGKGKGRWLKAVKRRHQIREAAKLPCNVIGTGRNTATLFMAVTWTVDRKLVENKTDQGTMLRVENITPGVGRLSTDKTGVKFDHRNDLDRAAQRRDSIVDPKGKASLALAGMGEIFKKQIKEYTVLVDMADGTVTEYSATELVNNAQLGPAALIEQML